ncbi:hypothetical protein [Paenibacillus chungangensis]|uniref:Uncharacterized protein n=1 Tax=Paenibacillus chungangensis TaxID=696535 RepID=A0ABW3HN80_9BACL
MMQLECICGNKAVFFTAGDRDDAGREYLELEDDDVLTVTIGEDSVVFQCKFCGHRYRLQQ